MKKRNSGATVLSKIHNVWRLSHSISCEFTCVTNHLDQLKNHSCLTVTFINHHKPQAQWASLPCFLQITTMILTCRYVSPPVVWYPGHTAWAMGRYCISFRNGCWSPSSICCAPTKNQHYCTWGVLVSATRIQTILTYHMHHRSICDVFLTSGADALHTT